MRTLSSTCENVVPVAVGLNTLLEQAARDMHQNPLLRRLLEEEALILFK